MLLYNNLSVTPQGHLAVGGVDTVDLARQFGAPLYVVDEDQLRANCRTYVQALAEAMPQGSMPLFAGKALCFKGLYPILKEEGMGADVVSPGEIYTALAGGFPPERLYFHGNNKTDEDIAYALDSGVGCFIVDNLQELDRLDEAAGARGIRQRVLLRVTPGIDPHTLQAINTGRIDCQFGVPIETGQAAQFVAAALGKEHLEVEGFHSHIGSQIFEAEPFCDAVDILLDFAQAMRIAHGFVARTLNLGGGFGVRYVESDPMVDIPGNIRALAQHLKRRQGLPCAPDPPGARPEHRGQRRPHPLRGGGREDHRGLPQLRHRQRRHDRQPPLCPLPVPLHRSPRQPDGGGGGLPLLLGRPVL